jgi:hypothetical protein
MNLNRAYRLIILAIIGIWGSSCEKTLSFDLGHDPLIVVQGMILEGEKASVDLHLSQARNSATGYKKVSDAIVTINSGSMMEVLKEEAPGKYYGEQLLGQAGQTYLLEIEWDKGIVSGMATMPEFHFHIDSLEFQRGETENRLKLWLSKSANAQFGIIRIYNEGNSITDLYMITFPTCKKFRRVLTSVD